MIQTPSPSILEQLLDSVGQVMSADFAKELVNLRATSEVQSKIDDLADKCNEGQLTTEE